MGVTAVSPCAAEDRDDINFAMERINRHIAAIAAV